MYSPKEFIITDQNEIKSIIENNPFAMLLSNENHEQLITHLPFVFSKDGNLFGHLAMSNPQSSIASESEVTVVFSGPHAYISPDDYSSAFNVPTWNYVTVHCKGRLRYVQKSEEAWQLFQEMVCRFEGSEGWILPAEERFKKLTAAIRFFYIEHASFEAKAKFNQNKDFEDIVSVISSLRKKGKLEVADYMLHITNKMK